MIISMAKSSENYPAFSQKIKLQKTVVAIAEKIIKKN